MEKQHRVNRSKAGYILIVYSLFFLCCLLVSYKTLKTIIPIPQPLFVWLSMFMSKPSIVPNAYHPKCEDLRPMPANTQSSSMLPRLSVLKRTKCTNKDRLFFDGYLFNTLLVEGLKYAMVRCSDACFHSMLQMEMKGDGTKLLCDVMTERDIGPSFPNR